MARAKFINQNKKERDTTSFFAVYVCTSSSTVETQHLFSLDFIFATSRFQADADAQIN